MDPYGPSPPTLETGWLCVDVDEHKIVNVYKPHRFVCKYPISQYAHIPVSMLATLIASMLITVMMPTAQTENAWARINNLVLLHNPKDAASFHSGRWNTSTNPDLTFVSIDLNSRLSERHVFKKFSRSQYRPSLITSPRFAHFVPSKPAKRWNFCKAKWSHYIALTKNLPSLCRHLI